MVCGVLYKSQVTSKTRLRAELVAATMLAPNVRLLSLRTEKPFEFVAGQWVKVLLEGDLGGFRAYSIASPPGTDDSTRRLLEIAVTRVEDGPVSSRLHEIPIGHELELDGPWGVFTLDRSPSDVFRLFVGTGTGVAPLRSMVHDLARGVSLKRAALLFGCRTERDVLFNDEFQALAERHPGFAYHITLSQPEHPERAIRSGYVQSHLLELLADHADAHVFVCGRSEMVKGVRSVLKGELGFDRKQIHSERYD